MKQEAETELIKTLNGQIKDLPSVAKMMVHQYQMAAIIECVAATLVTIALAYILYRVWIYGEKNRDSFGDLKVSVIMTEVVLGLGISITAILFFCELADAVSPIYGILDGLAGH